MTTEQLERIMELEEEADTDRFVDLFAKECGLAYGTENKRATTVLKEVARQWLSDTVQEYIHEMLKETAPHLVN
jgi:hypothetical protein